MGFNGFNVDVTKLSQAGARKTTPHENCEVLDVGSGSFPRYIEVRLPDDDGARQVALWDGSLNLEVGDKVFCNEYSGATAWRIMAMGGDQSGAGKVRVNKVWALDLSSASLVTDASDNVTINTGTLTLPSDVIHLGDPDTKWSFTDDAIEVTVGGLSMLKLTKTAQNLAEIGGTGGEDVDISFNNGQVFVRGSDGFTGFGNSTPNENLHVTGDVQVGATDSSSLAIGTTIPTINTLNHLFVGAGMVFGQNVVGGEISFGYNLYYNSGFKYRLADEATIIRMYNGVFYFQNAPSGVADAAATLTNRMIITAPGYVGIGTTSPQGISHSYDAISGSLKWEYDGLDATVRAIIPNGTGDVLYRLHASYVLRDSAAAVASGTTDVSNGASVNLTVGGNTIRLRVNANGSCDVARTAGTDTIKVNLVLTWL